VRAPRGIDRACLRAVIYQKSEISISQTEIVGRAFIFFYSG